MLNLFNYLTKEDSEKIKNYIDKYGASEDLYIGNEKYLTYWNESKKGLFHLLGGNLIYEVPYESAKDDDNLEYLMNRLLKEKSFQLIEEFLCKKPLPLSVCHGWSQLFSASCYTHNSLHYSIEIKHNEKDKTLKFQGGTKTLKVLQKLLIYLNADDEIMKAFEKFRIDHSMILNDKVIRGTLCFSIHPLDFMTMSDNNNGWHSCMSWVEKGCYRQGTVEMMNSNNVVCVYLKNDNHDFNFNEDKDDCIWNSKIWRQLFYCTKEIIVSGKSYPFYNEKITKDALNILRELAFNNWHHSYEFGIEKYLDMIHVGTLYRMDNNRRWIQSRKNAKKQNILFDSKAMYNDMLNDNEYNSYWCVRNRVKKNTIISYSGKSPCLCCGDILNTEPYESNPGYYEGAYNDRYRDSESLICLNCMRLNSCSECGQVTSHLGIINGKKLCKECWEKTIRSCPICNKAMNKLWLSSSCNSSCIINICEDCYREYFENIREKYLVPYGEKVRWCAWSISPDEKAVDCEHIKQYFSENLKTPPFKESTN